MKTRSVACRWLLVIVGACLVGMFVVSALGSPYRSVIAIDTHDLPAVSRHPIPLGIGAMGSGGKTQTPTAIWVVHQGNGWLALSDRTPHPRGCSAAWNEQQQKFLEPCLGMVFDRTGLNIGGPAPHGLDAYPVTVKSDTLIEVDVSRPRPVSPH